MTGWGPGVYGEPCRECGFSWAIDLEGATGLIGSTPTRYAALCVGRTGRERHRDLIWPVGAYVCHVADNFAIFAERLVGAVRSGRRDVAPYDENELAEARRYAEVTIEGALWSLERHAIDLVEAIGLAHDFGVVMVHPERGDQSALDVARSVAHDADHHRWDIERTLVS